MSENSPNHLNNLEEKIRAKLAKHFSIIVVCLAWSIFVFFVLLLGCLGCQLSGVLFSKDTLVLQELTWQQCVVIVATLFCLTTLIGFVVNSIFRHFEE